MLMSSYGWLILGFLGGCCFVYLLTIIRLGYYRQKLYTDKLTNVKNANYLEDFFSKYLLPNTSYLLIDIDNFKEFNSELGYEAADDVLKSFVGTMKEMIPENKTIVRYKFGDEFLIILPDTGADDALGFLSEFRNTLDISSNKKFEPKLPVYFSAGVTNYYIGDTQTSILKRLMAALSGAKKGKNKFFVA